MRLAVNSPNAAEDHLRAAVARLRPESREVLVRYYILRQGSQFQIAEAMGLTLATFNNRLNRARVELKRELVHGRGEVPYA